MRRIVLLIFVLMLICSAWAITSDDIRSKYEPNMDWFSAGEAMDAAIPEGLSEREVELFRMAYALGHYHAMHPEHEEGVYVLNTRTKKFHYTECKNTLLIDTPNREHSRETKEALIIKGYESCGSCKP